MGKKKTKESFILEAKKIHGDKYDYSKVEYINCEIREFLKENNIIHEEQKQFPWLKHKGFLKLDFYLPEYNIAIECQGEQHFEKFRWENDDKNLLTRQLRDDVKQKLYKEKGINIIYYTNIN